MKKFFKKVLSVVLVALIGVAVLGCDKKSGADDKNFNVQVNVPAELPIAIITVKDFGVIEAELYPHKAPNTVNNFISLANSGFYDGLTFHRVIEGFMNQGGCPQGDGLGGPGYTIRGEFKSNRYNFNDLKHTVGVLSMARGSSYNSAGSQFFIMAGDAPHLDGEYAAFGKVINGLDIVKVINSVETDNSDKPKTPVVIESIRVDTKGIEYDGVVKYE